ncbi:MAG TPA: 6-pyruvoyl tetrahydrobiopterin synthase [Solibacterales bacterium]|jgi:6-pyruvoyltetrahydropterin/6-carboxytetrahydropterin synthase|nr:6-pyruvoyl tetrahydrobiopterin synthase [Bryobacterales bacterium]
MITVTRRYAFSASHRLHSPLLADEANRELFGKCNNPFGHGHNYQLEVTVRGPVDATTGLAVDRETLDRLVRHAVLEHVESKDLNRDVPAFAGHYIPTTENLSLEIFQMLERSWRSEFKGDLPVLEKVRIEETARNIFEVHAHGQA